MQIALNLVSRFCDEFVGGNSSPERILILISYSETEWTTTCYDVSCNSNPLVFTARCTICKAQSCDHMLSVCLSVYLSICLFMMLMYHDHIGRKSWKLIEQTISPTSTLFIAQRSFTYSQGNMEKFWGENVCTTPTSMTSG